MDAVVNGIPVTPRAGAPVEINVLWYNALMFSLELAKKAGDRKFINKWAELPALVKESFVRHFWDSPPVSFVTIVSRTSLQVFVSPILSVKPCNAINVSRPHEPNQ